MVIASRLPRGVIADFERIFYEYQTSGNGNQGSVGMAY